MMLELVCVVVGKPSLSPTFKISVFPDVAVSTFRELVAARLDASLRSRSLSHLDLDIFRVDNGPLTTENPRLVALAQSAHSFTPSEIKERLNVTLITLNAAVHMEEHFAVGETYSSVFGRAEGKGGSIDSEDGASAFGGVPIDVIVTVRRSAYAPQDRKGASPSRQPSPAPSSSSSTHSSQNQQTIRTVKSVPKLKTSSSSTASASSTLNHRYSSSSLSRLAPMAFIEEEEVDEEVRVSMADDGPLVIGHSRNKSWSTLPKVTSSPSLSSSFAISASSALTSSGTPVAALAVVPPASAMIPAPRSSSRQQPIPPPRNSQSYENIRQPPPRTSSSPGVESNPLTAPKRSSSPSPLSSQSSSDPFRITPAINPFIAPAVVPVAAERAMTPILRRVLRQESAVDLATDEPARGIRTATFDRVGGLGSDDDGDYEEDDDVDDSTVSAPGSSFPLNNNSNAGGYSSTDDGGYHSDSSVPSRGRLRTRIPPVPSPFALYSMSHTSPAVSPVRSNSPVPPPQQPREEPAAVETMDSARSGTLRKVLGVFGLGGPSLESLAARAEYLSREDEKRRSAAATGGSVRSGLGGTAEGSLRSGIGAEEVGLELVKMGMVEKTANGSVRSSRTSVPPEVAGFLVAVDEESKGGVGSYVLVPAKPIGPTVTSFNSLPISLSSNPQKTDLNQPTRASRKSYANPSRRRRFCIIAAVASVALALALALTLFFIWPRTPMVTFVSWQQDAVPQVNIGPDPTGGFILQVNADLMFSMKSDNFAPLNVRSVEVKVELLDGNGRVVPRGNFTGLARSVTLGRGDNIVSVPAYVTYTQSTLPQTMVTTESTSSFGRIVALLCALVSPGTLQLVMHYNMVMDVPVFAWAGFKPSLNGTAAVLCPPMSSSSNTTLGSAAKSMMLPTVELWNTADAR